jgi:hypothetical protein
VEQFRVTIGLFSVLITPIRFSAIAQRFCSAICAAQNAVR